MGRDLPTLWRASDVQAVAVRSALAPLGVLYSLGWTAYLSMYRFGLKRAYRASVPVICVGSGTVGGSGKSPVTIAVAKALVEMGHPVVIGLSGYGSPCARGAQWADEGPLDARRWGDEPAMVRDLLPETPLVVGRDRVLAARYVETLRPDAVLVMDDGFQHLPLAKSASIVLDDPTETNRMCLPAGPYREPSWTIRRADLRLPGEFRVQVAPVRFFDARTWSEVATPVSGTAMLAIARPDRVVQTLSHAGVELSRVVVRADHDPLQGADLLEDVPVDRPIVTTHKDWVKLRCRPDAVSHRWIVVGHEVRIEPGIRFREWLGQRVKRAGT